MYTLFRPTKSNSPNIDEAHALRFRKVMSPLYQDSAQRAVEEYGNVLMPAYNSRMASKMGLKEYNRELSVGLLTAMYEDRADFTNSFRALADISVDDAADSIPESLQAVSPTKILQN